MNNLNQYKKKRDFSKTKEPAGDSKSSDNGEPIFVIQKHAASSLHYDLRLEADGVLKSWAVPKGPSTDPSEKRLAIMVEDHPLDYANFEGVIPEGNYGAGNVIVWDRGTYVNLSEDKDGEPVSFEEAINKGLVEIELKGDKMRGGYALKRMGGEEKKQWLLIKMNDEHADARRNPASTEPESVLSGKTVERIDGRE